MISDAEIARLQGPILVLGASGFVGANLMKRLLRARADVWGTAQRLPAWRLADVPRGHILVTDLLLTVNLGEALAGVKPKTIFNCIAYGAYSFETDSELTYQTNFLLTAQLLARLESTNIAAYIHCGSSSEYGLNGDSPAEDAVLEPNSHYAVSKVSSASLLRYYGKVRKFPCANLRLYSAYGPGEDSARLMPTLIRHALDGKFPPLVSPDTSRDFVYIDDVTDALIKAAVALPSTSWGESFNIGSGSPTSIADLARAAKELFSLAGTPAFATMPNRDWDTKKWGANPEKAARLLGWRVTTPLAEGLRRTFDWYRSLPDKGEYERASKSKAQDHRYSVSAVIACYKDALAIPIMYERLTKVFQDLNIDYEIIFVNDGSPDDSEKVIQGLSANDRRVVGISHARNFGSQAAFRSGMQLSRKAACVLLDGDLQDPPELIAAFVDKWRAGYDVVYGRRVTREASKLMNLCYKAFYRLFNQLSYVHVPKDAGDFSLLDRQIVSWLLKFPERDMFLRGLRAFVGFKQIGVDYNRPERRFGRSTNNVLRNIGWAKKGILSFSNVPLNALTGFSFILVILSGLLALGQIAIRFIWPNATPGGLTTVILAIMVFGSLNLLGVSVVGEYISKIFEEVKQRPHYIRSALIQNGQLLQQPSE